MSTPDWFQFAPTNLIPTVVEQTHRRVGELFGCVLDLSLADMFGGGDRDTH